jgi:hypothetical protein
MSMSLKRDIITLGRDIVPLRKTITLKKVIPSFKKITLKKVLSNRVKVAKIIKDFQSKAIARGERKPTDYQSLTSYVRKLTGASPAKVSRYLRNLPQWRDKAIAYDKRKNVHLEMYKKWCVFKRSTLNTPEGIRWSHAKAATRRYKSDRPENPIEIDRLRNAEKAYEDKYAIRCYDDPDEYAEQREEGMWYH